jgi:hypothetical protein
MKCVPTPFFMLLLVACFSISNLPAQDTVAVDPGLGTLQTAISQYGGEKVYRLEVGAHYELEGIANGLYIVYITNQHKKFQERISKQ